MLAIAVLIGIGLLLMVVERVIPDQDLPAVEGWWGRVIVINVLQASVVLVAGRTWEVWLQRTSLLDGASWFDGPVPGGVLAYLLITFVFYWWHRWRHEVNALWLLCHQVHHSPQRIETITSFYKHPLEITINSVLIAAIVYGGLGLSVESGSVLTLMTGVAEFAYHTNVKTPRWWGFILQRPEMHRIHHERGVHYSNFADLPVWDMLFGTYKNPARVDTPCGFKPEREKRLLDMLRFRNVNNPFPKEVASSTDPS